MPLLDRNGPDGAAQRGARAEVCQEANSVLVQERWRSLLDEAAIGVAVLRGPDHVFDYTNARYRELVGLSGPLDPLRGRRFRDVLPIVAEQGVLATLDEAYRTGETVTRHDFRTYRDWRGTGVPEERFFDFSVQPLRDEGSGQTAGVLAILAEITEKVRVRRETEAIAAERAQLLARVERERAKSEALFRLTAAVNQAASVEDVFRLTVESLCKGLQVPRAAVLVFDPGGVVRFRCWRDLSDEYRAAVEGHSPWAQNTRDPRPICVPDVLADETLAAYRPLFAREGIRALAFIPLAHSGRLLGKVMLYASEPRPFGEDDVQFARALADQAAAAVQNKLDQNEREHLIGQLRETLRLNERLAAILGHDLRTPLSSILTSAELLVRRAPNESLGRAAGRIVSSSHRMNRMIEQLLDYTRVREGVQIPVDFRPADLREILRQTLDELQSAWSSRVIDFEAEGDCRGVWDADRLAQVISNLLRNALQHGTPDHPVRARVNGTELDGVRFSVHNHGFIARELLPDVFQPFRGQNDPARGSRGLGLGLYITRELVNVHGGRIEVRSDSEDGTTFDVWLPRDRARDSDDQ